MTIIDLSAAFLIFLNIFVVSLFAYLSYVVFKSYKKTMKRNAYDVGDTTYQKTQAIIDDARHRAIEIVKESSMKANDVLTEAEFLSEDAREYLKKKIDSVASAQKNKLEAVSDELLEKYLNELTVERKKGVENIKELSKGFEKAAIKELDSFKHVLHAETVGAEKLVEQKLNTDYEQVKGEVNDYAQQELKKVDESINKLLAHVTTKVLGEAIDLEKHQNLIIQALEDAKKEGVFN